MVSRVAVLSDVQGVLPVLEAVGEELEVLLADMVVVTGNHAARPQLVDVLDRPVAMGDRVLLGDKDDVRYGARTPLSYSAAHSHKQS